MNQPQPIVNPLSGEQIVIRRTAAQTGGQVLDWELTLAPGGRVPSSHAHPEQQESFTVLEGSMRFRVGWRRLTATAGQQVVVPPGTVHHFANAGRGRPASRWSPGQPSTCKSCWRPLRHLPGTSTRLAARCRGSSTLPCS